MKTKLELPINKEPYIHSNTSRTSVFAVLTSEEYSGKLNAVLSKLMIANDNRKYNGFEGGCICKLNNIEMLSVKDNECIEFYSHTYEETKYAYLYKDVDVSKNYSIETTINYIQDSNSDSFIKIVLSEGCRVSNKQHEGLFFEDEISLIIYSNGNVSLQENEVIKHLSRIDVSNSPVTIKFENDSELKIKYSHDKKNWHEIYQSKLKIDKQMQLGVYISPKINPFYYDFYTSHIQLCYTDRMKIAPHFDYYERYFSKMIPVRQLPMSMIDITNKNIIEYFINLLEKKYYINLGVDEYYIPGRLDYQKRHHMHVNFIYGFDREKAVFKLIGFDKFMKYSEIDFESFFYAIQRDVESSSKINLYKYSSKCTPVGFNIEASLLVLQAYLTGDNIFALSASEVIVEDINKPLIYGLKIHEIICNDENHMSRFLRGIRIIYQIYEHNLIMKEMLKFINHIGILPNSELDILIELYDEVIRLSSTIKNIILKNTMNPKVGIEHKVREMMIDLQKKETVAVKKVIRCLEQFLECKRNKTNLVREENSDGI